MVARWSLCQCRATLAAVPLELEAGPARARIDPEAGGRLASLCVDGLELLVGPETDPLRWGCYPMAPFAGRVRGGRFRFAGRTHALPLTLPPHAIHGTTWRRAWQLREDGSLGIDLGPDWPFPGHAVQRFVLDEDALSLRIEVHAVGEPFPASAGWHPWFRRRLARGGPLALRLRAGSMYERDAEGIPSGALRPPPPGPWDDCFTALAAPPELHWPGALRLTLTASVDHWVVYDEPAHALCVEPQSGPPDALNLAPRVVSPGDPLVATARFAWERG